jgi:hypothetical protein
MAGSAGDDRSRDTPQKNLDTFNKQPGLSAPEDSHNLKIINKNL